MTMEQKQATHLWINTGISVVTLMVVAFYAGISYNRLNNHEERLTKIEQQGSPGAIKVLTEMAGDMKVIAERLSRLQADLQKHMDTTTKP